MLKYEAFISEVKILGLPAGSWRRRRVLPVIWRAVVVMRTLFAMSASGITLIYQHLQ